jgi:hypothetical protein
VKYLPVYANQGACSLIQTLRTIDQIPSKGPLKQKEGGKLTSPKNRTLCACYYYYFFTFVCKYKNGPNNFFAQCAMAASEEIKKTNPALTKLLICINHIFSLVFYENHGTIQMERRLKFYIVCTQHVSAKTDGSIEVSRSHVYTNGMKRHIQILWNDVIAIMI